MLSIFIKLDLHSVNVIHINVSGWNSNTKTIFEPPQIVWSATVILIWFIVFILQCLSFRLFLKHLYFHEYDYGTGYGPSRKLKLSAILYALSQLLQYLLTIIILGIGYALCKSNILSSLDVDYVKVQHPAVYFVYVTCLAVGAICFLLSTFGLFPLHILFRLQNMKKQEHVIRNAFSESKYKYFNVCMYFGIFLEFVFGLGFVLTILIGNALDDHSSHYNDISNYFDWFKVFVFIVWCMIDIIIHAILLRCYLKGLFRFSQYCYQKDVHDQVHEKVVDITKYSVLFTIYMVVIVIMNIILLLMQLIWNYQWSNNKYYVSSTTISALPILCFVIRDIVSLIVMFFSFKFSYHWYKDIFCGKCDNKMRNYCEKKVKEANDKRPSPLLELQQNLFERENTDDDEESEYDEKENDEQ